MNGFVACIRRSGSGFYKVPRAASMNAVPVATQFQNLNTYFVSWPRRFSTYVLYEDKPASVTPPQDMKPSQKKARPNGKFSLAKLRQSYDKGQALAMVTAYDSITARLAEEGGIDIMLVGDSVGNVMLGYESTVPVTMDEMVVHTRSVTRTTKRALVVGDMPFGSYLQVGPALENAARLMKEGGCDAVKLEGGERVAHIVKALVDAGIAVMGHIGLTPQTHAQLGGYRMQGKTTGEALRLIEDAKSLQRAGAFAIVLECVPTQLAEEVTKLLQVPTIGIGAGPHCSGQVLVCADMLGTHPKPPRFVKQYASLGPQISAAFEHFRLEVEQGAFPEPQHSTNMAAQDYSELQVAIANTTSVPATTTAEEVTTVTEVKPQPVTDKRVNELLEEVARLRVEVSAAEKSAISALQRESPRSRPAGIPHLAGAAAAAAAASFVATLAVAPEVRASELPGKK